jgi:hypothetical protein
LIITAISSFSEEKPSNGVKRPKEAWPQDELKKGWLIEAV